jgi:hypothetical protein
MATAFGTLHGLTQSTKMNAAPITTYTNFPVLLGLGIGTRFAVTGHCAKSLLFEEIMAINLYYTYETL